MKGELKIERMNLFSDVGAKYRETLFSDAGTKSRETLFDRNGESSEALFRGNDKTFDEIPWSKEYLTSILLHKLKE